MGWVQIPGVFYAAGLMCGDCKYYPGDGAVCPKTGQIVYSGSTCCTTKYRVKIVKLEDDLEIDAKDYAAVGIFTVDNEGAFAVLLEPVFPYESK